MNKEADKAGDILICRRMKLRGIQWSKDHADSVLNIHIKTIRQR